MAGPDSPIAEGETVFQGNITWPGSSLVHGAEHRPNGILIAYGPQVVPGVSIQGASIGDLAPTLTHMMGLPVPSTMEGRVLAEILSTQNPVQYHDVESQDPLQMDLPSAYSQDEEALVQKRLQSLGYLR
jgi:hypothetical protein